MEIKGEVFSGMGVGAEYLSMQEYEKRFREILGWKPFPGTLNLRVGLEIVEELRKRDSERLETFKVEDQQYSGMDIYKCKIEGREAAFIDLDVTDYGDEVMEIIAPVELREELDLEDGYSVTVRFN